MEAPENQTTSDQNRPRAAENANIVPVEVPAIQPEIPDPAPGLPITQQQIQNSAQSLEERMSGFERSIVWLTVAAVIISGITLAIFILQFHIMRGQLDEMARQYPILKQTADAAKNAVSQSQQALDTSIDEFRVEHRAWLILDEVRFYRADAGGVYREIALAQIQPHDTISLNTYYKNVGSTPAFDVCTAAESRGLLTSEKEPQFPPMHFGKNCNPTIIPPGMSHFQSMAWTNLPESALSAIRSGVSTSYLHGRIEYRDAFGVNHWTTFCNFLTGGGGWASCKNGNQMDNNPELPNPQKPN